MPVNTSHRASKSGKERLFGRVSAPLQKLKADVAHLRERVRDLSTPGYMDPDYNLAHKQLQVRISKTYSVHGMGPELAVLYRHLVDWNQMRMEIVRLDRACTFGQRVVAKWALEHPSLPDWALTSKEKAYRDGLWRRMELLRAITNVMQRDI